jgi:hypothetical protein
MRLQTATSLALLGVLTLGACSDDGGSPDADPEDTGPETAGAMTQEQVETALLPIGETVGEFKVRETPGAELNDVIELDDEVCQPLSSLVQLDTQPAASAWRSAGGPDFEDMAVQTQLLSYGGDGAAEVFAQVEQAVAGCADGFEIDPIFTGSSAVSVEALDAPPVGDDAAAYRIRTRIAPGGDSPHVFASCVVVARGGHEVLLFKTLSLVAGDCDGVPREIVDAQWERYTAKRG